MLWGGTWRSLNGVRNKGGKVPRAVPGDKDTGAEDVVGPIILKKCDRCPDNTADHLLIFLQFIKETS